MSNGSRLAALRAAEIKRNGEQLTVTRRDGTSQTLYAVPYPLSEKEVGDMFAEASLNAAEDNPHLFTFAGTADVRETQDKITYDGTIFRVSKVNPRRISGVAVSINALGIREGPA